MTAPIEPPPPPHSDALNNLLAAHRVPDAQPPDPEMTAAGDPVRDRRPEPPPPVAEPAPAEPPAVASIPTPPARAGVFQSAPGDRRSALRRRAADRSRQRKALSP